MDREDGFDIVKDFVHFPVEVIDQIIDHLPLNILLLLRNYNPLRKLIVSKLFTEIHFIASPPRVHDCHGITHIDDVNFFVKFLKTNPDSFPEKLQIVTGGGNFGAIIELVTKAKTELLKIKHLEILIERCILRQEHLNLLSNFPNLIKWTLCLNELTNDHRFTLLPTLKELIVLGQHITSLIDINLEGLITLDISYNNALDSQNLNLPSSLENLYLNQSGLTDERFDSLYLPESLQILMMNFNSLSKISRTFPNTLKTLDLSFNNIDNLNDIKWPDSVEDLLLTHNKIQSIEGVIWPPYLKTLKLNNNKLTDLNNVIFPDTIDYLDLDSNHITTMTDFSFPNGLKTLQLSFNLHIQLNNIEFPLNLRSLNIDECGISDLSKLQFPPSLINLSLSGNKIVDVLSYGKEWPRTLKVLELFYNLIENIDHWRTPPNLKELNLSMNRIEIIRSINLNPGLRVLNISENKIRKISGILPYSLKDLNLSQNCILSLDENFVINENLQKLKLKNNSIKSFNVHLNPKLKYLDLTSNQIKSSQFHEIVRNSGLTLKVNKLNSANHIHEFQ